MPDRTVRSALPWFPGRDGRQPRILIEDADDATRQRAARALRRAGYQVAACAGPGQLARRRCPLEEGAHCPAVDDADLVLSSLPADDHRQLTVLAALRQRFPDTPVIVEASRLVAHRHRHLLRDWVVLPRFSPTTLPDAVEEALGA